MNIHKILKENQLYPNKPEHFIDIYGRLFDKLGDDCHVMEIGVASGHSIAMWCAIENVCKVIGIDINITRDAKDFINLNNDIDVELIEIAQGLTEIDSTKVFEDIKMRYCGVLNDESKLSLIIDDASHNPLHTISYFFFFWSLLKSGGFYVIEDWAAYSGDQIKHGITIYESMITEFRYRPNHIEDMIDTVNSKLKYQSNYLTLCFLIQELGIWMGTSRGFSETAIKSIHIEPNIFVIEKR